MVDQAVILCGGQGARLRSIFPANQKVALTSAGQPMVSRIVEQVCRAGVQRIVLALGYRANDVLQALKGSSPAGVDIVPSVESKPLGTGGALRLALPHVLPRTALVMNGDSYAAVDLSEMEKVHRSSGARVSVLLVPAPEISDYGTVALGADGQVLAFNEKTSVGEGLVNAGVYIFERSAIESIKPDTVLSLEKDIFPGLCGQGLFGVVQRVAFHDIGTPDRWRASDEFFRQLGTTRT